MLGSDERREIRSGNAVELLLTGNPGHDLRQKIRVATESVLDDLHDVPRAKAMASKGYGKAGAGAGR